MHKGNSVSSIVLIIAILIAGGWYVYYKDPFSLFGTASPDIIGCSQEAMICPDGSAVTRTGPNCEFAECAKPSIAQNDVSTWKTYRNEEYGFEFKYPETWKITKGAGDTLIYFYEEDLLIGWIFAGSTGGEYRETLKINEEDVIIKKYADNPCGGFSATIPKALLVFMIPECTGWCNPEDYNSYGNLPCKNMPAEATLKTILSTFKSLP